MQIRQFALYGLPGDIFVCLVKNVSVEADTMSTTSYNIAPLQEIDFLLSTHNIESRYIVLLHVAYTFFSWIAVQTAVVLSCY